MKIKVLGAPTVIMSNDGERHHYFGWPTIARLGNGKWMLAASGFRRRHVCPFGKCVVSVSEDEGGHWSAPQPVIDTVLDDRDGGLCAFGESGVMLTSFNNTTAFQRKRKETDQYDLDYLDSVTAQAEREALGVPFRLSFDAGQTWSRLYKSPVTSPHGPCLLQDGTLLWVGRPFSEDDAARETEQLSAYRVCTDGSMHFLGRIEPVYRNARKMLSCEPHAVQLPDGSILCHFRVQEQSGSQNVLTLFESRSFDGGRSWSAPVALLSDRGGAPAHLLRHSSGVLISSYGYRNEPFGIRLMLSSDNARSWQKEIVLWEGAANADCGYPATVECTDGSLYTVFYARIGADEPARIYGIRWKIE